MNMNFAKSSRSVLFPILLLLGGVYFGYVLGAKHLVLFPSSTADGNAIQPSPSAANGVDPSTDDTNDLQQDSSPSPFRPPTFSTRRPDPSGILEAVYQRSKSDMEKEYGEIFAQMGLTVQQSKELTDTLATMIRVRLESFFADGNYMNQRSYYNTLARNVMGPEKYEEYARWESQSLARKEYGRMEDHLAKDGIFLSESERNLIVDAIDTVGAFSSSTVLSGGAASPHIFEENTKPYLFEARGSGAVDSERFYLAELENFAYDASLSLMTMAKLGVDPKVQDSAANYYAEVIADRKRVIGAQIGVLLDPLNTPVAKLSEQLATIVRDPGSDPATIELFQTRLDLLEKALKIREESLDK